MSLYSYGDHFFAYQQIGALSSARSVVPILVRQLNPASVLDVGCGAGAWVAAYRECGMRDVIGVDADYVREDQLLFGASDFHAIDVGGTFRLGRTFGLAQCLEVAEHLDPSASAALVDNLVAHAPIVVFSAAPPGQGGEHHVNERPYEFWRDLFEDRGYGLFDFIRPKIRFIARVEHWYRYNMLVFVRHEAVHLMTPAFIATRIDPSEAVPDLSPVSWRMRRRVLSVLPPAVVTRIAAAKHRMVLRSQGVPARTS